MTEKQDQWAGVMTKSGLQADQVISALQKEIRRGNAENAVVLAYEMIITSSDLESFLWKRLKVISVEDIGFGNTNAPILVSVLSNLASTLERDTHDRILMAVHAVRYLSGCLKDRSSDEMLNWVKYALEKGEASSAIPDYALDMHTAKGRSMGRGRKHFYNEGTTLFPELPDRELEYRQRIMEVVSKEKE